MNTVQRTSYVIQQSSHISKHYDTLLCLVPYDLNFIRVIRARQGAFRFLTICSLQMFCTRCLNFVWRISILGPFFRLYSTVFIFVTTSLTLRAVTSSSAGTSGVTAVARVGKFDSYLVECRSSQKKILTCKTQSSAGGRSSSTWCCGV